MLHLSYQEQIRIKQRSVEKLLKPFCPVLPAVKMEDPFRYRNKVHAVFGRRRDGKVISGTYEKGSHRIVPLDTCLIDDTEADAIIRTVRELVISFGYQIFDEDTGRGLIRHVLVRVGKNSGQILVVLVTSSPVLPSKKDFVRALTQKHPSIRSVVLNVNARKTSMVLGDKEVVLYGPGYIEDQLCSLTFRISSRSFYQVNTVQTRLLYETAVEFAQLTGKEKVFDAYCGIGTIGMTAASKAIAVLGVERNPNAVSNAKANARLNHIANMQFVCADATEYMEKLAGRHEKCDVLFLDPPREGTTPSFIRAAAKMKPSRIVYISCNPVTLARDLGQFEKAGYKAAKARPVDMFPQTEHCESVVKLLRRDEAVGQ